MRANATWSFPLAWRVNRENARKVVTASLVPSQGMLLWLFLLEACWLLMLRFGQWFGSLGDASHASICKYYHQSRRVTSYLQSLDAEAPKHQVVVQWGIRSEMYQKCITIYNHNLYQICIMHCAMHCALLSSSRKGERHDVLAGFLCWNRVVESRHQR